MVVLVAAAFGAASVVLVLVAASVVLVLELVGLVAGVLAATGRLAPALASAGLGLAAAVGLFFVSVFVSSLLTSAAVTSCSVSSCSPPEARRSGVAGVTWGRGYTLESSFKSP